MLTLSRMAWIHLPKVRRLRLIEAVSWGLVSALFILSLPARSIIAIDI
jgi:hypothetical protein